MKPYQALPLLENPTCEAILRNYSMRCTHRAKWRTPHIPKRQIAGLKVCGYHKHRFEAFGYRCTPL
jgi:hypothetical protein